jgi:hypothetical protein
MTSKHIRKYFVQDLLFFIMEREREAKEPIERLFLDLRAYNPTEGFYPPPPRIQEEPLSMGGFFFLKNHVFLLC